MLRRNAKINKTTNDSTESGSCYAITPTLGLDITKDSRHESSAARLEELILPKH